MSNVALLEGRMQLVILSKLAESPEEQCVTAECSSAPSTLPQQAPVSG